MHVTAKSFYYYKIPKIHSAFDIFGFWGNFTLLRKHKYTGYMGCYIKWHFSAMSHCESVNVILKGRLRENIQNNNI